jgi:hypothetical protein
VPSQPAKRIEVDFETLYPTMNLRSRFAKRFGDVRDATLVSFEFRNELGAQLCLFFGQRRKASNGQRGGRRAAAARA